MPIEFNCDSCSRLLRVPDGTGGKSCQCPGCGELLEIPSPGLVIEEDNDQVTDGKLHIPCPKCKHELVCDPKLLGTKGQCRNCKQIFTITESPTSAAVVDKAANLVFSCPKCNQLFEGKESMEGRRGKCHACGDVFNIKLRAGDSSASDSSVGKVEPSAAKEVPPTSAFSGPTSSKPTKSSQQSTPSIKAPASRPESKSPPASSSRSSRSASAGGSASTGRSVSKSTNSSSPQSMPSAAPIRFSCTSCAGVMEVPGSTAGQITVCPYCSTQLTIPPKSNVASSTPSSYAQTTAPTSPAASVDIFSGLNVGSSAPTPAYNPYPSAPAMPSYGAPVSSAYSAPRRSSGGNSDIPFIVAGVIIAVSSVFEILSSIGSIIRFTIVLFDPRLPQSGLMAFVVFYLILSCFVLILSSVKLLGGIALARRVGLGMARTAAVLSCFPFICCLPIGIWACVLTFSKSAERRFD